MYSHIEDKNYNHLVCVILGGSEKECKLHGLAHVGEHMCLLSCFDNDESYTTFGYTCIDHAVLYFASKKQDSLYKIQSMIEDKSIVREDRVEIAKHQVISECENLSSKICAGESAVRFITDNRVKNYAAGKIEDIREISLEDVMEWLSGILAEDQIYFFQLDKLNLDKIDKQIMCQREYEKYRRGYEFPTVRVQLEVEQKKEYYEADVYMPLDIILDKKEYLQLIVWEYFLEKYLETWFYIEGVEEKYFSFSERYLLIHAKNMLLNDVPLLIHEIRQLNYKDVSDLYMHCKIELYQMLTDLKKEYVEDKDTIRNLLIKKVAYGVPVLKVSTDTELINMMDNSLNAKLVRSLKEDIRIIIR